MNEFELIKTLFAPLATAPGALGLRDDAAVIAAPEGSETVITKDLMVEGVHFLKETDPGKIAQKLLRVNLSDLAAMGATPQGYLLGCQFANGISEDWMRSFALGLAEDQRTFGLSLLGGDTTRTPGPMAFSLTALGHVPVGQALRRGGAKPDDDVWVSGTIGDGALGLAVAQGNYNPALDHASYLRDRLDLPTPRLELGAALRGLAHSAVDISDGLMADLGHIAESSELGIELNADLIPLSAAATAALASGAATLTDFLSGGDDFELAFTAPESARARLQALSQELNLPLSRIGRVHAENLGVTALQGGQALAFSRAGYQHF